MLMPPEKFDTVTDEWEPNATASPPTWMPRALLIEPALVMPPAKVEIVTDTPAALKAPTKMPLLFAAIMPLLLMPPEKAPPLIAIAVPVLEITLLPSRLMPPAIVPVEMMEPVMVPLLKVMPPGEIVPSLVMLPVKLVLVTATHGVVCAAGLSKPA